VGPIARTAVFTEAKHTNDIQQLYRVLAVRIASEEDRATFLRAVPQETTYSIGRGAIWGVRGLLMGVHENIESRDIIEESEVLTLAPAALTTLIQARPAVLKELLAQALKLGVFDAQTKLERGNIYRAMASYHQVSLKS